MAGYQTEVKLYKVILKQNKNIITFGLYCWVTKQFIMFYIITMTTQRILHYKVEIRPPVSRNPSAPKSEVVISSLLEADVDTYFSVLAFLVPFALCVCDFVFV